jgi:hypothetical protein
LHNLLATPPSRNGISFDKQDALEKLHAQCRSLSLVRDYYLAS